VLQQARLLLERINVVDLQADDATGALAAGLHTRPAIANDDDVAAQLAHHLLVAALKAFAGRRQDDDGDDAPGDAEHGQEAAQLVRRQIRQSLSEKFTHGSGQWPVGGSWFLVSGFWLAGFLSGRCASPAGGSRTRN